MYYAAFIALDAALISSSFPEKQALLLAVLILLSCLLYFCRVGSLIVFLFAGLIAGPHTLGLVQDIELIHGLVEIGAVLLFFLAGTRFVVESQELTRPFLHAAGLQVCITIAVALLLLMLLGVSWQASLFTGLVASLGSTALIPTPAPYHLQPEQWTTQRTVSNILHYQSLFAVFMLLLVSLVGNADGALLGFARSILMLVAFVAVCLVLLHTYIPRWLEGAMQRRGREEALIIVLTLCSAITLVAGLVGLGLAIAAFLAGFTLSGSKFRGGQIGELFPLTFVARAFFFIPLGMLLDLGFLFSHWPLVVAVAGTVFLLKLIISHNTATNFGIPAGVSATTALMLVPLGELAFLIFYAGRSVGLSPAGLGIEGEQTFIATSVVLLVVVSLFMRVEPVLHRLRTWTVMLTPGPASDSRRATPAVKQADLHPRAGLPAYAMYSDTAFEVLYDTGNDIHQGEVQPHFIPVLSMNDINGPSIRMLTVQAGAPASGSCIGNLDLRDRLGVLVLGIWRRDIYLKDPPASFPLLPGDRAVLSGRPIHLDRSRPLFQNTPSSMPPDTEL